MISVREVQSNEKKLINEIVSIHLNTFEGFFLTFMGRGFLNQMYKSYCDYEYAGLLVAEDGNKTLSGFYWIVPFVFTMCLVLFPFDVKLHEGGIGVKILFGVMIVRYCISPLLNTMTNLSKYGTTETIWV